MNPSRTLDIVLKMTDNASGPLRSAGDSVKGFESTVDRASSFIEQNWVKITAGATALGVGLEAMGRKQAENTRNLANLGVITNRTTQEMRDLATGLRNVTLPMGDVVSLLEAGARQGLETNEELEQFVRMWDMVSDATGIGADRLAEQSMALRRVGIDANNTGDALDAFGFVTKNTMLDVDDLLDVIERRGREIEQLGLNLDQTAALMQIMQERTGASGRVLRQEFTRAISDANDELETYWKFIEDGTDQLEKLTKQYESGKISLDEYERGVSQAQESIDLGNKRLAEFEDTLEVLLKQMGVSREEFDAMTASVKGHSSVIEEMAQNYADSFTPMQRIQDATARLAENYGGLLQTLTALTPVLLALGPVLKGLVFIKGALAGVTLAVVAPYLLIAAAIGALVIAGLYLWRNWEDIANGFRIIWERISLFFTYAIEGISERWNTFTSRFKLGWEVAVNAVTAAAAAGARALYSRFIEPIVDGIQGIVSLLERARAMFESLGAGAGNVISGARDRASGILSSVRSTVTRSVNDAIISPRGDIITTHPDDYLIATKTPGSLGGGGGVTVIVNGDVSGTELIERVKSGIMQELGHNIRLTST